MKNIQIILLLLLFIITLQIGNSKLTSNKHNQIKKNNNKNFQQQAPTTSQLQTSNQQYVSDARLSDFSNKQYRKEDFYLFEEGVTNLAYDDFIEGKTDFIPNIEYLGSGYNVAYGNPKSLTGIDPGYTNYNAFEMNYKADKLEAMSLDGDYFIPDGVVLRSQSSCNIDFKSQEIETLQDYEYSLSVSAEFEGSSGVYNFRGSMEYQQAGRKIEENQTTTINSEAICSIHKANINRYQPPIWSKTINKALDKLLRDGTSDGVFHFFERFGTHISVGIELGAKYGYFYELNKSSLNSMKNEGLSVELGASGLSNGGSMSTSYSRNSQEQFENATLNQSSYSVGSPPNADNDVLAWAANSKESPMPIKGQYIAVYEFINQFRDGNFYFTNEQLDTLSNLLESNILPYCTDFLKPNGIIDKCDELGEVIQETQNIPGGIPEPGRDYNHIGGYEACNCYDWEFYRDGVRGISVDELGMFFFLDTNQRIQQVENPDLPYQTTHSHVWGLENTVTQIDGRNGRLVALDSHGWAYKIDVRNQGRWQRQTYHHTNKYVTIDNEGIMFNEVTDNGMCRYDTNMRFVACPDFNRVWSSTINGLTYGYHDDTGEYYASYNPTYTSPPRNIQPKSKVNWGHAISGCITNAGWGWKVWSDGTVLYMPSVFHLETVGNFYVDGPPGERGVEISCASSSMGPYVYLRTQSGKVFRRRVQL